jgi:hypothetical protein
MAQYILPDRWAVPDNSRPINPISRSTKYVLQAPLHGSLFGEDRQTPFLGSRCVLHSRHDPVDRFLQNMGKLFVLFSHYSRSCFVRNYCAYAPVSFFLPFLEFVNFSE